MQIDVSKIRVEPVKVYYLRMEKRVDYDSARRTDVVFEKLKRPIDAEIYLKYYHAVGFQWHWLDRLVMPRTELSERLNADNVHIYALKINGVDGGFAEMVCENDYVELLYFGLMPERIGQGLGRTFLNLCIETAWSFGPRWVQLNTCELDHNNALPTYRKLGFIDYKTTMEERRILDFGEKH